MAISIVVWIRFVLTVAFGTVAFGTVAFGTVAFGTVAFGTVASGMACLTKPAEAGNQDLGELIQMLETGDALTCEQALTELVPLGPKGSAAVDAVCRHLGARSLLVRSMASDALVAIGSKSIEPLKQHLGDTSPVVRATSVQTLGRLKAVSLETLAKLVDDPDARVRASVAIAIGHSEYEDVARLISELLRDDEPVVLVQACRVLKSNPVSPTEMVPALIEALSITPTSAVVMETLSIYGTDAQSAIPELIARASEIKNQSRSYRDLSFAKMLARIGPPSQKDITILARWLGTSDPEKTGIIAETLARMKVADVSISNRLEQLTHELLDQGLVIKRKYAEADWEIRDEFDNSYDYFFAAEECVAAYWSVTHDSVRFIDLVERIARETETKVYFSGDMGLAVPWRTFSETDAVAISKMLKSKNQDVIGTALFAFDLLGPLGAGHTDLLIELMKTRDSNSGSRTLTSVFADIGISVAEKALPAIVQSFKQGRTSVHELAEYIDEVRFITEPSQKILIDGLNSSSRATVEHCAYALCRTSRNPEQTVELLLTAVDSGHLKMLYAIEAMQKLAEIPDSALEFLMTAFSQEDERLRVKTATTLAGIGPRAKKAVPAISLLLKSNQFDARLQAATALFRITGDSDAFEHFVTVEFSNEKGWDYERMGLVETIISLGDRGEVFHHHINRRMAWLIEKHLDSLFRALERSKTASSIKLLKRISKSKDWLAKTKATTMLDSIRATEPTEPQR